MKGSQECQAEGFQVEPIKTPGNPDINMNM